MCSGTHAQNTFEMWPWKDRPMPLLVSFFYMDLYRTQFQHRSRPYRKILDSGAFSAYNSGKEIDIAALCAEAQKPEWNEAIALDVIGDADQSIKNLEYMAANGAPHAYPVFHIGDPWDLLDYYCERYPKLGLSCRFGESLKVSKQWARRCFARRWPHRFHSFGWVGTVLHEFPFDSADTSIWNRGPTSWGAWKTIRGKYTLRAPQNMVSEVEHYYREALKLKHKWKKELAKCPPNTLAR